MQRLIFLLLAAAALASEHVFSVHDDVLAYPQFEVVFSESYMKYDDAVKKLKEQTKRQPSAYHSQGPQQTELSTFDTQASPLPASHDDGNERVEPFELMRLGERLYFCSFPVLPQSGANGSSEPASEAEQQIELARAVNKGWELLQDLEGKCLYFVSGWWSYSFCYNSQVKQFHQLPPGNGAPIYPPQEDPTTPAYILGRFSDKSKARRGESESSRTDIGQLQMKGETRYLVQKLEGGTTCDLTGANRKVEVQFHCHPQSTDRIGFIKEITTCTYLMVIYTPRLCNDVAFLPAREDKPHAISCCEVLTADEIPGWEADIEAEASKKFLDGTESSLKVAGNIEIGAKQLVGDEGRRIEKGRVVTPPEERADIVAKKEKGEVRQLSKEDMRKMDIDPEAIEAFRKELQEIAGNKDWKLEVVDEVNGVRHIRGVVEENDPEEENPTGSDAPNKKDENRQQEGSEEEYKEG